MKEFIQTIEDELFIQNNIFVDVLRLDLAHPLLQGNKYYKLKYNLKEAKNQQKKILLTFGGAFSNHILATSFAGKIYDFKTIGIIRGEETLPLNETLKIAKENGMGLFYVDRVTYQQKNKLDFIDILKEILGKKISENDSFVDFSDIYIIPEGGSNDLAIQGTSEILEDEAFNKYSHVCVCAGTGGTLAGIVAGKYLYQRENQEIIGVCVLKNGSFLREEVNNFLKNAIKPEFGNIDTTFQFFFKSLVVTSFSLVLDYHFGGYAKNKPELALFMENFTKKHKIPLEFVYTGKLFYAIFDLIKKQYFPENSRLLIIHTGGLR